MNSKVLAVSAAAALAAFAHAAPCAAEPRELEWEDLMPPGEEEKLDQMYLDYFAELERQTRASIGGAQSLFDFGGGMAGGIMEGSALDQMVQLGTFNTVDELDGQEVRIPGYIVPFDFSADDTYQEFLLAPYFGACIHSPPPPPNQIVYVKSDKPIKIEDIWPAVWIEGTLHTARHENDLGDAAYTLSFASMSAYETEDAPFDD